MLPDDVVRNAIVNDLPRLQGRFEGFSESMLRRVANLERKVAQPKECAGLLGQWFGHSFIRMTNGGYDLGMICRRCGHAVWADKQ